MIIILGYITGGKKTDVFIKLVHRAKSNSMKQVSKRKENGQQIFNFYMSNVYLYLNRIYASVELPVPMEYKPRLGPDGGQGGQQLEVASVEQG